MTTREINVELDGKKLWPLLEYVPGDVTGVALLTNEELSKGDGIPSVVFRIEVADGDGEPLVVLADIKVATLVMVLASVRGRLEHLQQIRDMVTGIAKN